MVRGATRFVACAALALSCVAAAFSPLANAQHAKAPRDGGQAATGPGSIGGERPGAIPVDGPSVRPQSLLGRPTDAGMIRGEVAMRQNGRRFMYQAITPNGEAIQQAATLGLTHRAGQPVELVGVNTLVVGFRTDTTLAQATAFFQQNGLVGQVEQKGLLRNVFTVRTATALGAFQAGDALYDSPLVRFAHPDLYAEIVRAVPELELTQGATTIASGGLFDFGATTQGMPVSFEFTITNTGDQPLTMGPGSVPAGFFWSSPTPLDPIAPGDSYDFLLRLTAENVGAFSGDLEILSNSVPNPFVVTLEGTVNATVGPASVRVSVNGTDVNNGGMVSFGTTPAETPVVRTFVIHNDGADPLTIGTVNVPAGYTVTAQPVGPVAGGTATSFTVQLDAEMDGTYTGTMSFLNNDADDNPFSVSLTGTVSSDTEPGDIADPLFENQWHLENTGQDGGEATLDINIIPAWAMTLGDGALIAVMDSSVQPDHPDYAGNIVPCPDCVNFFDLATNPMTGIGNHGTSTTGLIVAADNTIGVRGGAPNAQAVITSYIGLDGEDLSVTEMAENWAAAAETGASVHSNSWGFGNPTLLPDIIRDTIVDLTENARDGRGMLFLFATANSYTLTVYGSAMAAMEETLGVGGVDNFGNRPVYADFGLGNDVVGPTQGGGLAITTTDVTGEGGYNDSASDAGGDYTNTFNGTSASTPIVAGVAALVMAENPNLHAAQLKRILMHTASANSERNDLLGVENQSFNAATSFSESYGYGLPDAHAAVLAAGEALINGNMTWPAPARDLVVNQGAMFTSIGWTNPPAGPKGEYAGALVVRLTSLNWKPEDGVLYTAGDRPADGVEVIAVGDMAVAQDMNITTANAAIYAVYIYNPVQRYSFGELAFAGQNDGNVVLADNFETDRGWFAAPGGEWQRGAPELNTINIEYLDFDGDTFEFLFDTPPRTRGFNAPRSGASVYGTDLDGTYAPDTEHVLYSPIIDLENSNAQSVYLSYWELLEIASNNPNTTIRVEVVDASNTSNPQIIRVLRTGNPGNIYTWTPRRHDLSTEIGRRFRIRFTLSAPGPLGIFVISQFQGWFLDDFRIAADGTVVQPPPGSRRPGLVRLPPPGGFIFGFSNAPAAPITGSPDVNADGSFDTLDVMEVATRFGASDGDGVYDTRYDFNDDGVISYFDLGIVLVVAADPSSYTPLEAADIMKH